MARSVDYYEWENFGTSLFVIWVALGTTILQHTFSIFVAFNGIGNLKPSTKSVDCIIGNSILWI